MRFTTALMSLALALAGSASATDTLSGSQVATLSLSSTTANATGTINAQALIVSAPHSVFGYIQYNSGQTTSGYSYYSQFNTSAPAAATTVAASNAGTAQYQVGSLLCPVCIPAANITNTNGVYTYSYIYSPVTAAATLVNPNTVSVTANATTIADTNVALVNASANPLSLRTPANDNRNQQPGKLLYFTVAAQPNVAGNNATATFTFAATATPNVNPFTDFYLIGAGKCPSDSTNTGRFHQSLASLTTLTGTVTVPNITVGTYWVYLAPSATPNTLAAGDTLALTLSQFSTGSCTADANGFCSGAATLKSVVGVAFAGVMAAAFMLF